MSRILLVADDPRTRPYSELHWWRHHLRRHGEYGFYCIQRLDRIAVPESHRESWEYEVWSGYIDYFDGRNDWSFPYEAALHHQGPYLDILAVKPPNPDTWYHLRENGRLTGIDEIMEWRTHSNIIEEGPALARPNRGQV